MTKSIYKKVTELWEGAVQSALMEFIKLPALSVDFNKNWEKDGLLLKVVKDAQAWAEGFGIRGLASRIVSEPGHPPCLLVTIKASDPQASEGAPCVFFYGHLDKQPENEGWSEGKAPWTPVIEDGKLYGRGAVDDGYAIYTSLAAVKALQDLGIPHPRCTALFETAEESGSGHYTEYLDSVQKDIGPVGLVVALDSVCGDYERLWLTSSLRGMIGGALKVKVLEAGVHSGEASGVVPSSFMILRRLLDRVEDSTTGKILIQELHTKITDDILQKNRQIAQVLGDGVFKSYPWAGSTEPLTSDPEEALLNRNWRPEMTVSGMDGIPSVEKAGNVMRMMTRAKLGIRLPPDVNAKKAALALAKALTENAPFSAEVSYESTVESSGWVAPKTAPWLEKSFEESSGQLWGAKPCYLGMGASIPLLNDFLSRWPSAQFMVAGALGPHANAHGPDESLDIGYALKLTASVAAAVAASDKGFKEL